METPLIECPGCKQDVPDFSTCINCGCNPQITIIDVLKKVTKDHEPFVVFNSDVEELLYLINNRYN